MYSLLLSNELAFSLTGLDALPQLVIVDDLMYILKEHFVGLNGAWNSFETVVC